MNKRIKKKKRKQTEAFVKMVKLCDGIYELNEGVCYSLEIMCDLLEEMKDCCGHISIDYFDD